MKVRGERVSADVKAAEEFLETLPKLIVEENYLPKQIQQEQPGSVDRALWQGSNRLCHVAYVNSRLDHPYCAYNHASP